MSEKKISVLIADDHTIVRAGLRVLLEGAADMEVVGEASEGNEALALAESLRPDVVIMDIAMPGVNGLEGTRRIKERFPDMHVIALTMHSSDEYFFEMLKAGASGYVLKAAPTNELLDAVREVSKGRVFLHPTMTKQLLRDYLGRSQDAEDRDRPALTPREEEILRLLAGGYSTSEIAEQLFVTASTVHTHRTNVMRKLGLHNRRELFRYARRRGMISDS